VRDLIETGVDVDADTAPPDDAQFCGGSWPDFREFLNGHSDGRLEYDSSASVLRRWVYGWISSDFRRVEQELKSQGRVLREPTS
jgi:hypothetical protein